LGEGNFQQNITGSIRLRYAIAGEGRVRLGGVTVKSSIPVNIPARTPDETTAEPLLPEDDDLFTETDETAWLDIDTSDTEDAPSVPDIPHPHLPSAGSFTAVWNEFAVLFSQVPILPEEIDEEDDEAETEENSGNTPNTTPVNTSTGTETVINSEITQEETPGIKDTDELAEYDSEYTAGLNEETQEPDAYPDGVSAETVKEKAAEDIEKTDDFSG